MIKGKYTYFDSEESKIALNIRDQVLDPLNLPNRDEIDDISVHGIAYFNETIPVASGRITYLDGKFVMSRISVLKEYQRKKIGDFLVRMLVDKAFCSGTKAVFTDAPVDTVDFFKSIGFTQTNEKYISDGIEYVPLTLKLENFRTGCGHAYCPSLNK